MSRRSFGTIRKLGSGRFQVRYRNTLGRLVPGPRTLATKAEAQRWLATAEADQLDELAIHLATHRQGFTSDDLVFLGPKGGIVRRSFEARVFKPAVEAAGLPENLTFHGLRHVATTLTIATNEHPKVIRHRLGPAMSLGVYGHVPDDLDRDVAGRLDRLFTAAQLAATVRLGP